MHPMPQTLEETVAAVDAALFQIIHSNYASFAERIRAISLFYKRHQVGGFAPQKATPARALKDPQPTPAPVTPQPAPTPTQRSTATAPANPQPPLPPEPVHAPSAMPPPLQTLSIPDHLRAIQKTLSAPHNKVVSQRRR